LNKIGTFKVKLIKFIEKSNFKFGAKGHNLVEELKTPSALGSDFSRIIIYYKKYCL